jgi:hypothetical protein
MRDWEADLRSTITPTPPLYTEPYDFKYALLEYDEKSEFRKITTRAFFNMPQGQEFDCRSESIVNPALPTFSVISPISGSIANNPTVPVGIIAEDLPFFRTLTVSFDVLNEANLSIFNAKTIKIFLDNRLKITTGINTRRVSLSKVTDGRHTMKLEMYDEQDRLISGTQAIVLFAYTFIATTPTEVV